MQKQKKDMKLCIMTQVFKDSTYNIRKKTFDFYLSEACYYALCTFLSTQVA